MDNPEKIKSPEILAFGFSDKSSSVKESTYNLSELPGSIQELDALEILFDKKFKGYKGKAATKDKLLENLENYHILHLSLHAESDQSVRQNSRIYFHPFETLDSSEYILYAHDIYQKKIKSRLVVLDACETGKGKQYIGEGTYSIAKGFSYAGVPTVLMSLWNIGDQSNYRIILSFYERLKEGFNIDHALQLAKLDYLESADEILAHPSNWAGIVSVGDQSAIFDKSKFKNWILFFLLVTICLFLFYKNRQIVN